MRTPSLRTGDQVTRHLRGLALPPEPCDQMQAAIQPGGHTGCSHD